MKRIKLNFQEWPVDDQQLWLALLIDCGPLDDVGGFSHLRESTISQHEAGYGRWLAWIKDTDLSALDIPPAERITPTRVLDWMKSMNTYAAYSRVMRLDTLLRIRTAFNPEADVAQLRRIRAIHHAQAQENNGQRKQGRILSSAVLLQAGLDLAGPHAEAAHSDFERVRRLRNGTMLAFLALLPIRLRSFVGLELDSSVLLSAAGIEIILPADMTKTGVSWQAMAPEPLCALLRRYLCEARPFLFDRGPKHHSRLWVADTGLPLSYGYLARRIPELTEIMLGVRVPPHFFRDAAATTLARESSASTRITGPLLGHTSFKTAERHYNHARTIEAGLSYSQSLHRLRSKS
jgi:integrase/recombinase XerD